MASTCKQVRDAIEQLKGKEVAEGFSDEELQKLYEEGYRRPVDLLSVSRDSLLAMGLRKARVDALASMSAADGNIPYFIPPKAQALVKQSVFYILEDDSEEKGIGVGVFYGPQRAVTADHNLTEDHKIGSLIKAKIPETMEEVELRIIHRDPDSDFAILESSLTHPHVPIFTQSPTLLMGSELVLASFRIGIEEEAPLFSRKLGFAKASAIVLSEHMLHLLYACPTFAGDSGAALILRDGRLVGLHQESVNALRERLERKKATDRLAEVEQSVDQILAGGLAQGCVALLVQKFANM